MQSHAGVGHFPLFMQCVCVCGRGVPQMKRGGGGGGGVLTLRGPPVHLDVLVLDREIRYTNSLLQKTWAKSTSISIFLPKPYVRLSAETNESRY